MVDKDKVMSFYQDRFALTTLQELVGDLPDPDEYYRDYVKNVLIVIIRAISSTEEDLERVACLSELFNMPWDVSGNLVLEHLLAIKQDSGSRHITVVLKDTQVDESLEGMAWKEEELVEAGVDREAFDTFWGLIRQIENTGF